MRALYVILCFFALVVFLPAYARAYKLEAESYTSVSQEDLEPLTIEVFNNRVKVTNAPVGSVLEVYSVVGQKVKEIQIKESSAEYPIDMAKGYYILRVGNVVRKVRVN